MCSYLRMDCSNPMYEEWETEYHDCLYNYTQDDPQNRQDDHCETHADCRGKSAEGTELCCGQATAYDDWGWQLGHVQVCNDKDAYMWHNHMDMHTWYSFVCLETAQYAIKVGASAVATVASVLYFMD